MIVAMDWPLLAFGLLCGAGAGALFFAGLAWGMRVALRRPRPVTVLLPSAALRIGLLLAAGVWIAGLGTAALLGFMAGFFLFRVVMILALRPTPGGAGWS